MTAYVYHEIACDYEWRIRAPADGNLPPLPGTCFNAYNDRGTATEVRRQARRAGWLVGSPGGKDYCPEHAGRVRPGRRRGSPDVDTVTR